MNVERAREHGAFVVRDSSQALLSQIQTGSAHYTIFSPRKFLGVPDGGVLFCGSGEESPGAPEKTPAREWRKLAIKAATLRSEFDLGDAQNGWFRVFQQAETLMPVGCFKMSGQS